jgi:hypothetical protein
MSRTNLNNKVDLAYDFLTNKLNSDSSFASNELGKYTGWKDAKATISKKLMPVLSVNNRQYIVKNSFKYLTQQEFRDLCSQKNDKINIVIQKLNLLNKTYSEKFLDKSVAACMSAIEIYNKPDFSYREENFAILMVNAWELLLKSKILKDNSENIESIYDKNKDGTIKYKKNTNNTIPLTKNIDDCIKAINDPLCAGENNLLSLIHIRDTSVHFIHEYPQLKKDLHSITLSCLNNFFIATKDWFGKNYDEYNFYALPLTFSYAPENKPTELDILTKNLWLNIQNNKINSESQKESRFSYALTLECSPKKAELKFKLSNDETAINIIMKPEDFKKVYKWEHSDLVQKLKQRYSDFKADNKFNVLKKNIKNDRKYCHINQLSPGKPKSPNQTFYCPETCIEYFDKSYTKKPKTNKETA